MVSGSSRIGREKLYIHLIGECAVLDRQAKPVYFTDIPVLGSQCLQFCNHFFRERILTVNDLQIQVPHAADFRIREVVLSPHPRESQPPRPDGIPRSAFVYLPSSRLTALPCEAVCHGGRFFRPPLCIHPTPGRFPHQSARQTAPAQRPHCVRQQRGKKYAEH